ncbi:MAG: hypothetical protein JWL59_1433 [Chthoniobacteraceae bacterium]|nr:hypothetical protein [Chthoniobacteraceae bacterium]
MQLRIDFPDALNGLYALPSGRHPHIDEGRRVRVAGAARCVDPLQPFLSLEGRFDSKAVRGRRIVVVRHPHSDALFPGAGVIAGVFGGAQQIDEDLQPLVLVGDDPGQPGCKFPHCLHHVPLEVSMA